jgi:O-antigen/teichoic acid export membrane protein
VVGTAVRYVSVAGFSRLSEQRSALSEGVRRSVPMLVTGLVPIATLFAVLAPEIIGFLFGEKWAPAAAVLPFLMILMVVRMLTSFTLDILIGAGVTRWTLWLNLIWAVALVPALLVGTHVGGIRGTAIAHALVGVLVALPIATLALSRAGVRVGPMAPELVRPLLGGAVAGTLAYLVARVTGPVAIVQLLAAGVVGTAGYLAIAIGRRQLREWSALVRRRPAAGTD